MLLFLKIFFTEFIAEMGDKTQLMLIALTSKYKLKDIILGTAAAILVLNGLAVLAGGLVSEFIPAWLIKIIAALAFLYFAVSTIAGFSVYRMDWMFSWTFCCRYPWYVSRLSFKEQDTGRIAKYTCIRHIFNIWCIHTLSGS